MISTISANRKHQIKAKSFIDNAIDKSRKPYSQLMADLDLSCDRWSNEHRKLSYINIFDLTSEQYDRKNYLSALLDYSEKLLRQHKAKANHK
jgi:DNA-binding transcriptional regulator GbsR (MarR family)